MKRSIRGAFPVFWRGVIFFLLLAGWSRAQTVPKPGSVKERVLGKATRPPKLVLPGTPAKEGPSRGEAPRQNLLLDQGRVRTLLSVLSRLPKTAQRAQKILDLFAAQDPRALQATLAGLFRRGRRGGSGPLKGSLRLLEELRFTRGLPLLKEALLQKDLGELTRKSLQVVLKLDPAGGKAFLFQCLAGKVASSRRAAEDLLRPLLSREDLPTLADLLDARRLDTRVRALRLLAGRLPREGEDLLLAALKGPSLLCAREAARGLARIRPFPRKLTEILSRGPAGGKVYGYALYAALLAAEKGEEGVLRPEWAPLLLKGLSLEDPFVSSLSAAALARISYASEDLTGEVFHDKEVMDKLVEVLSGSRFFPEFGTVIGPVERAARLFSGKTISLSGRAWKEWWKIGREGFLARRARLPLGDEKNRARCAVVMKDSVETVGFYPRGAGETPGPGERALFLPPAEQARLVGRLLDLGIEEKASASGGGVLVAGGGGGLITFSLRLEGREMTLGGPAGVPWVERIADQLRNTIEKNLWQLYGPPPGPARETWWEEQNRFFAAAGKAERARRLERIVMDALPHLKGPSRVRALGHLLAIPGLENLLSDADVDLLLSLVGKEQGVDSQTRALLEVVALKRGEKTWRKILAFLAPRWDRGGESCFLSLLAHASPGRIQAALSWKDAPLRAATVFYLGRTRNAVWRDPIRALLRDSSGAVRAAALDALASLKDWASLGDVLRLARKDPSLQVRRSALLFAGRSRDRRVLPVLLKALESPLGSLRNAAIRGLGLSQLPRAADILAGLLASDPDGVTGKLAALELSRWGNGDVRAAVRPLLGSPSSAVREAALWVLADSLDGSTIPGLLRLLREPAKYERARTALTLLSCKEFSRDVAASYARWYEVHGSEPEAAWFVEGLKDAGYHPGFGATDLLPGAGLGAAAELVSIMKNGREWYFRVQAARRLQEITGKSFGVVTARTPPAEREAIAQAWLGWLQEQQGKTAR